MSLQEDFQRYRHLVDRSMFKGSICFLVNHPRYAFTKLHYDGSGFIEPSCWGTIVFLMRMNTRIKRMWRRAGNDLGDYCDALGDYVCIPNNDRPGYVGRRPMQMLLDQLASSDKAPDAIVGFYWQKTQVGFCGFGVQHAALYLGIHDGDEILFHQIGRGEDFEFTSLAEYENSHDDNSQYEVRFFSA